MGMSALRTLGSCLTMSEDIDTSNMGRCDVCGKPIDMRDAGDDLVIMEAGDPEPDGHTEQDAIDAMVRALRGVGTPEDHAVADAYEEEGGFKAHEECYQKTSIPDFPTTEDYDVK